VQSVYRFTCGLMLLVLALQYAKSGRAKCKAGKSCQDVIPQVCLPRDAHAAVRGNRVVLSSSLSIFARRASCAWEQWRRSRTEA